MFSDLNFSKPDEKRFNEIKKFIRDFRLDDRDMNKDQFLAVCDGDRLLGFGRIKDHGNCEELCSLGVIEPERRKGLGTALATKLISLAIKDLYVVCIIPEFFQRCGFTIVDSFPASIGDKLQYCVGSLSVPEKYVVMKR